MKTIDDFAVLPSDLVVAARRDADAPHEVVALGFSDGAFGYISTGGGASLEFIRGKTLPGLAVLDTP